MKLYLGAIEDNFGLWDAKPDMENVDLAAHEALATWNEIDLRVAGYSRKFPKGKQLVRVELTIK